MLNLLIPEHAYIFGFLQADGSLYEYSRNRSKLSLEINVRDKDIIDKILKYLPIKINTFYRTRTTNFKKSSFTGLNICNFDFKEHIKSLGLPAGEKSDIIAEPVMPFSRLDYYRGIIDGDGSLGTTETGLPFISLVTSSDALKISYCQLIEDICDIKLRCNRNKRDDIYNISLFREPSQILISKLYYENCFALNRKINKAKEALAWIRPENMKRRTFICKHWTHEEDNYILTNPVDKSVVMLGRTIKSIKTRLYRLNNNPISPLFSRHRSF